MTDCPEQPAFDYPRAYSMIDLTNNWNTDSTELPSHHYDSLCHFNYQNETELKKAYLYRQAEKPFVVYNVPEVDEVVRRWTDVDYLNQILGKRRSLVCIYALIYLMCRLCGRIEKLECVDCRVVFVMFLFTEHVSG